MGLDMYFYEVPKGRQVNEKNGKRFYYLRKHYDLHNWLKQEWLKIHPEDADAEYFDLSCVFMRITPAMVKRLKNLLDERKKEYFEGSFWENTELDQWKQTQELIQEIESIMSTGRGDKIYYYPC